MRIFYTGELWEGGTCRERMLTLRGLGHELRLVDHVAPRVLAPDEVRRGVRQPAVAGVRHGEAGPEVVRAVEDEIDVADVEMSVFFGTAWSCWW